MHRPARHRSLPVSALTALAVCLPVTGAAAAATPPVAGAASPVIARQGVPEDAATARLRSQDGTEHRVAVRQPARARALLADATTVATSGSPTAAGSLTAASSVAAAGSLTATGSVAAGAVATANLSYVQDGVGVKRINNSTTVASDTVTGSVNGVAWSGDGSRYAYATGTGLFTRTSGGTSLVTADARASLGGVTWHPRGFEVAGTITVSSEVRIILAKSDGTDTYLADAPADGGPENPTTMAFLPSEDELVVTSDQDGSSLDQLTRFDLTAGTSSRLLPDHPSADDAGVQHRDPALSPSGEQLAYVQEAAGGARSVWVMNTDGTDATQITSVSVAPGGLAWTPDGLGVYLLTTTGGNKLQVVDAVANSTPTVLVDNLAGSVRSLTVRPVGTAISADRLAGTDRIATSVAISHAAFANRPSVGSPTCDAGQALAVVLARSDMFPDGLVAGPLAAAKCAPLLLTPPTTLDSRVLAEIKRILGTGRTVYVIGSTGALSTGVENSLKSNGFLVTRYFGADRYATAVDVAKRGLGSPQYVLLASGVNFPDALAAGPAAAAIGGAVLLSAGSAPAAATNAYLALDPDIQGAAIGGPALTAYPWAYPVSGSDRYATVVKVAEEFFYPPRTVFVANGQNFPDALSGGALAALTGNPLLLTAPTTVPSPLSTLVDRGSAAASFVVAFGQVGVVSSSVVSTLTSLAAGKEPWLS